MPIIQEPLVEGVYQSLLDWLQISTKRDPLSANVGRLMKDEFFFVFQVYPEENGIVWGRISSNIDGLGLRVVPLRVANRPKAILVKKLAGNDDGNNLVTTIGELTTAINDLTAELRKKA
jgi:hypothetical protein